jgi:hypothetical protein
MEGGRLNKFVVEVFDKSTGRPTKQLEVWATDRVSAVQKAKDIIDPLIEEVRQSEGVMVLRG